LGNGEPAVPGRAVEGRVSVDIAQVGGNAVLQVLSNGLQIAVARNGVKGREANRIFFGRF
jgi:hypothetical protein